MTQPTPDYRLLAPGELDTLRSFAGLTDDALAHLVLIGMLSTADAQTARLIRKRSW